MLCTAAHPRFTCRTHASCTCCAATTHSSHPEQFHSTHGICVTKRNRSGLDRFTRYPYAEHLQMCSVRAVLREGGSCHMKGILQHQHCHSRAPQCDTKQRCQDRKDPPIPSEPCLPAAPTQQECHRAQPEGLGERLNLVLLVMCLLCIRAGFALHLFK